MVEGNVQRGEVYWIGQRGSATLGLVVSADEDNRTHEWVGVAALCMVKPHRGVATNATGTQSWVCCSSIKCVHKNSFQVIAGKLTRDEMNLVDNELEKYFDLGYEDEDKEREIACLKREVANGKAGIQSREAEVARYKMLYEKAVEQIAEMQVKIDVANRVAEKRDPEPEEDQEPDPEIPKKPKTPKKVNVNTATVRELMQVGFGKSEAARIVCWGQSCGGFDSLDDLTAVDGVTGKMVRKLRDKLEI